MVVHFPTPCRLTPSKRLLVSSSDHFLRGFAALRFALAPPLVLSPSVGGGDVMDHSAGGVVVAEAGTWVGGLRSCM